MTSRSSIPRTLRCYTSSTASVPLNLSSTSPYIRSIAGPSRTSKQPGTSSLARDFLFWPTFFNESESRELLKMGLWKLDRADTTRKRRRRTDTKIGSSDSAASPSLQDLFEGEYGFEEVRIPYSLVAVQMHDLTDMEQGHYDSVIHDYRETLLSSLPPSPSSDLTSLLVRLYSLIRGLEVQSHSLPPQDTSTHLLHLSPKGVILPHVDNLEASGSVILGLSLGAERTMRLKHKTADEGWELRLPSGSVYLQRYVCSL